MTSEHTIESAAPQGGSGEDERNRIVVFALDEPRYALPLSGVDRVVRAVEITPLPNAPPIVQGMINVRGAIVPVVDIRKRLSLPERAIRLEDHFIIARTPRRSLALAVDYVSGIREIAGRELESAGRFLPPVGYLRGVAKTEDNLILIYDLDSFLALDEGRMLDDALSGGAD